MLMRGLMYLLELFSAKEDQVQLVTFLLSAGLAIVVLLINQMFVNRRSKRDFLLSKIEELSDLSIEYASVCGELIDDLMYKFENKNINNYEISYKSLRKINTVIRRIELICELYFENTGFSTDNYHVSGFQIIEYLDKWKQIGMDEGDVYALFESAYCLIDKREEWLAEISLNLAKRCGH
ncbi:hypothetical protein A6E05_19425 [Aliivibrio sp. 1S165]|nr:hypothetical protein A6E05_19425 [Aliivibrio sp. 1S165]